MTPADLFKRLNDIAASDIDWIRLTLSDDREVVAGIVERVTEPYERHSHGVVDLSVEFSDGTFEANDDFQSDVGYVYQRQTGRNVFTDVTLNVWDLGEEGPSEVDVGTVVDVEETPAPGGAV